MTKLEQYLQDYLRGSVSTSRLQNILNIDAHYEQARQDSKNYKTATKLYIKNVLDPLDIICEQERLQEIAQLMQNIIKALPPKQREI
ncbi:hypothetical protein [Anaerosinus massiliensis]|uniref:hypothetical protein n=1 Tax=Massilibacillus massiliensis TaxID=1806837 RepID=UPI000DA5FEE4|nr:hypothetical protein [Massilibacillus massiliensis]